MQNMSQLHRPTLLLVAGLQDEIKRQESFVSHAPDQIYPVKSRGREIDESAKKDEKKADPEYVVLKAHGKKKDVKIQIAGQCCFLYFAQVGRSCSQTKGQACV